MAGATTAACGLVQPSHAVGRTTRCARSAPLMRDVETVEKVN
jgi:hypothetical protein